MKEVMTIIKALADENRVRTLMALREKELCVCDIIEFLGLAPSTVSKHLSILYQAGLVEYRKEGRWVYYRLASENVSITAKKMMEWLSSCLENETVIIRDMNALNNRKCK